MSVAIRCNQKQLKMEKSECESVAAKDMDKCATIYRKDPSSFVYVCYHCGATFSDIDCTLQHVETHFQLVQVTIDENPLKSECADYENSTNIHLGTYNTLDQPEHEIKTEVMESEKDCGDDSSTLFDCQRCDSVFSSKFSFRSHVMKEHFQEPALECDKCGKMFKRDVNFENHLRQHIERGEVDWSCTGDGIREPKGVAVECPALSTGNSNQTNKIDEVDKEWEKRPKKKRNKTTQVRSKKKTRQISTYICHKCSAKFSSSDELNGHLNVHSSEDMLLINKCKECKRYFESAFDLRLHVLEIHLSAKKFRCSTCFVEFEKEDKSLLEEHLELHLANDSANWKNICQGICRKGNDVLSFECISTVAESSCENCEEKFYLKSNLDEHTRCSHTENEHELRCPQCDSVFIKLQCYFAHQLEHRRVGATVTETDINVLVTNLNSYIEAQFVCNAMEDNAINPYKCLICYVERSSPFEIRRHVRERHVYKTLPQPIKPNLKEKYNCNICGLAIKRNSFRTHLMTHTDIKLHSCSTCGKTFRNSFTKTTHERLHTGEKPFQCDSCGKRFFSNSLLGAHKKSHDNTTYPCTICGRIFNVPSGYRRHIQIHRKDKSFECTVCFKSFNTRVYLTRHMFKHAEKNYQCNFCENKFNTASGLKQHEKNKHNYEPS